MSAGVSIGDVAFSQALKIALTCSVLCKAFPLLAALRRRLSNQQKPAAEAKAPEISKVLCDPGMRSRAMRGQDSQG